MEATNFMVDWRVSLSMAHVQSNCINCSLWKTNHTKKHNENIFKFRNKLCNALERRYLKQ